MPVIRIETFIQAPIERCFDLARDADAHVASTEGTQERMVERTGTGPFELATPSPGKSSASGPDSG